MEGNGPTAGTPVNLEMLLAGGDLLAVDTVAAQVCGMSPRHMPWLENTAVTVVGPSIEEIIPGGLRRPTTQVPAMGVFSNPLIRSLAQRLLKKLYSPLPTVEFKECIQCHACEKGCPQNAITLPLGVPIVDKKNCIRCYCCSEACESGAMTIPQPRLARWIA
jgi:ferredoxin